jgi:hypothetical protein
MFTDKEASKKWCPHVRSTNRSGPSTFNRWGSDDVNLEVSQCIGSACMMWKQERISPRGPDGKFKTAEPTGRGRCGLIK